MSIDVDDVLAVAIAHALADLGEVKLVAVLLNVNLREGASTISAINRYFGRDVPIGMYDGPLGDPAHCAATPTWVNSCRGFYATDVARRYPTFALQNQSALELYRQALHDATDGSIRIASIGFASNLRDLLRSPPDALSPLSGEELLQRKVTKMYMMGGRRLNGNPVVEWNVAGCSEGDIAWIRPAATECGGGYSSLAHTTHEMLSLWPPPVPIVFVGYEDSEMIHTGDVLVSNKTDHVLASPMREAYLWFCSVMPWRCEPARSSWDPITVLIAIREEMYGEEYYSLEPGHFSIDPSSGLTNWQTPPPADLPGNHSFLVVQEDTSPSAYQWPSPEWKDATRMRRQFLEKQVNDLLLQRPHRAFYVARPQDENQESQGGGFWGGACMCGDGQVYQVGDQFDYCGSLSCVGGMSGPCNKWDGPWSGKVVHCATSHKLSG